MTQKVTKRKYEKALKEITEEELEEIRRVNREKLDEIYSKGPEYMITLAIKYYGDNWMACFAGEETYLSNERVKHRDKFGSVKTAKGNRGRPLNKLDLNSGEFIRRYENVYECVDEEGYSDNQMNTLMAAASGRYPSYKGWKWEFADNAKIVIYGEDDNI
jgi:hypothetical protein